MVETGLMGTAIYILILLTIIHKYIKISSIPSREIKLKSSLLGGIIGYTIIIQTLYAAGTQVSSFFILTLAAGFSVYSIEKKWRLQNS